MCLEQCSHIVSTTADIDLGNFYHPEYIQVSYRGQNIKFPFMQNPRILFPSKGVISRQMLCMDLPEIYGRLVTSS